MNLTEKYILFITFKGRLLKLNMHSISTSIILDLYYNDFIDIVEKNIIIKNELTDDYKHLKDVFEYLRDKEVKVISYKNYLSKSKDTLKVIQRYRDNLLYKGYLINDKKYIYKANQEKKKELILDIKELINDDSEKNLIILYLYKQFYYKHLNKEEKKYLNTKLKDFNSKFSTMLGNPNAAFTVTFPSYLFPIIIISSNNNSSSNSTFYFITLSIVVILIILSILSYIILFSNIYKKIEKNKAL